MGNWSTGGVTSQQLQARDMPHHTKMKYRSGSQLPPAFDSEAAKGEADEREEAARAGMQSFLIGSTPKPVQPKPQLLLEHEIFDKSHLDKWDDRDDEDSDDDSHEDDSDDDDDDELALQLELDKIKKEREEERVRKEAQETADAQAARDAAALTTNPLLNDAPSGAIKRKWNDDVVFRNQARGAKEHKKQFINDTVRNDFHKRFLAKYVQ